ncbi:hypothetical protein AB0H76_28565 [Nocardia sp. NPDC050712]|uniref:hypothetical protein n=1 Tax=Nocardia sp. NPDC050712 TaxID=3155518 RepID=UPI003409E35E
MIGYDEMTEHGRELRYTVSFPEYLDGYEFETEAKGYLVELSVATVAAAFTITVFDPARLTQEIADEVAEFGYCTLSNVLVVPAVTRAEILRGVERLARGGFDGLHPQAAG